MLRLVEAPVYSMWILWRVFCKVHVLTFLLMQWNYSCYQHKVIWIGGPLTRVKLELVFVNSWPECFCKLLADLKCATCPCDVQVLTQAEAVLVMNSYFEAILEIATTCSGSLLRCVDIDLHVHDSPAVVQVFKQFRNDENKTRMCSASKKFGKSKINEWRKNVGNIISNFGCNMEVPFQGQIACLTRKIMHTARRYSPDVQRWWFLSTWCRSNPTGNTSSFCRRAKAVSNFLRCAFEVGPLWLPAY